MAWILAISTVRGADPTTVLRIEAGMHVANVRRISTDVTGRLVLTVSDDKTARLWKLDDAGGGKPTATLLRVLRTQVGPSDEGKLYACALSSDGSVAAVGGWTNDGSAEGVYLFDSATGRVLRRLTGATNVVTDLAFSASSHRLAASLGGGAGLRVWDTASGKLIGQDAPYAGDSYGVDWHGEDQLVTASNEGRVRLYEVGAKGLRPVKVAAAGKDRQPFAVRFSPDGKKVAVGYADSAAVEVRDARDLSLLFSPDMKGVDNGNLGAVAWSADGQTLAASGRWREAGADAFSIRIWEEAGRGPGRGVPAAQNVIVNLRARPGGGFLYAAYDPAWGVVDLKARPPRALVLGSQPIADHRQTWKGFRVSTDGSALTFSFANQGISPATFSIPDRRLTLTRETPAADSFRAPRLSGIDVNGWFASEVEKDIQSAIDQGVPKGAILRGLNPAPKLGGKALRLEDGEKSRSFAVSGNAASFLLGTDFYLRNYSSKGQELWRAPAPAPALAANSSGDGRLVIATYGDGTVRWHRADNGRELLAFFPHADRERWVLWTPEGFYDCSPGGEELIGWQVNRGRQEAADFFAASKFRDRFYRPDVISRVLETRDVVTALKSANSDAGRRATTETPKAEEVVAKAAPPVVELAVGNAGGELSVPADSTTAKVKYRVRRTGEEPIKLVRVLVDGRPVKTDSPVPANSTAEAQADVPLPAGRDSVISILAEHRFAVSEPAVLRVVRAGAPSPPPAVVAPEKQPNILKPKLYLLAAGISDYLHNDQLDDLHFAAKDAADFAAAFRRQEGGLYQKIEAKVLGDKDATAANILDGLDWIKQQTTAKDVAVIFLSGHGENDEELRYYFCPHDYDKSRRLRTGVSFEEIQKTVRSIPGKMLFFIDSCHAGNALGKMFVAKGASTGVDVTGLVNELSGAENGAIVFTSSTGRQLSLELASEGNGAFTKAIVEGLDGRADLLRNGKITVSTLEAFIAERVKELTDGQQTPTVAKPQTVPDFPIGIRK